MQELISRLTEKVGLSADQASKAIDTIKDFAKEKFPMMAGGIDSMFASDNTKTESTPLATAATTEAAPATETSIVDKISDIIPGAAGEKIEDFAKGALDKAEDVFGAVKGKLGGLFGGDNK